MASALISCSASWATMSRQRSRKSADLQLKSVSQAAPSSARIESWRNTYLRVRDDRKSVDFYMNALGMRHVHTRNLHEGSGAASCVHVLSSATNDIIPTPGLALVSTTGALAACESDDGLGNSEGEGFGHIAFAVDDVYAASDELYNAGWPFMKRAGEGQLKHIAFLQDPDGNGVELIERAPTGAAPQYALSQTMLRSQRPSITVPFYEQVLGFTVARKQDLTWCDPGYTNYFLARLDQREAPDPESHDAREFVQSLYSSCQPVIELSVHETPHPQLNTLPYDDKQCVAKLATSHLRASPHRGELTSSLQCIVCTTLH